MPSRRSAQLRAGLPGLCQSPVFDGTWPGDLALNLNKGHIHVLHSGPLTSTTGEFVNNIRMKIVLDKRQITDVAIQWPS